jgi:hypothetical protein
VSVRLYIDVHLRRSVTDELRLRKVDVLTAQDDESANRLLGNCRETHQDIVVTNQQSLFRFPRLASSRNISLLLAAPVPVLGDRRNEIIRDFARVRCRAYHQPLNRCLRCSLAALLEA